MYRRIELISDGIPPEILPEKTGLCGIPSGRCSRSFNKLRQPSRKITKNCRFYFTEKGWRKLGRHIVADMIKFQQRYRVITVKEHSVDVVYQDDLQVAVRPRKKRA